MIHEKSIDTRAYVGRKVKAYADAQKKSGAQAEPGN